MLKRVDFLKIKKWRVLIRSEGLEKNRKINTRGGDVYLAPESYKTVISDTVKY